MDANAIGDVGPLELLLEIKALSLDYNAVRDVSPLDSAFGRSDLVFLSIDGRPNSMTALPGSELYSGFGLFGAFTNPDDPTAYDYFGNTVVTTGNKIIVAAPYEEVDGVSQAGVVRVFDAITGELLLTIENPDPDTLGDSDPLTLDSVAYFGESIATVGDKIVIGAPGQDYVFSVMGYLPWIPPFSITYEDAGAIYVFDVNTGEQIQRRFHPTLAEDSQFGGSISLLGSDILVGAAGETVHEGIDYDGAGAV